MRDIKRVETQIKHLERQRDFYWQSLQSLTENERYGIVGADTWRDLAKAEGKLEAFYWVIKHILKEKQ